MAIRGWQYAVYEEAVASSKARPGEGFCSQLDQLVGKETDASLEERLRDLVLQSQQVQGGWTDAIDRALRRIRKDSVLKTSAVKTDAIHQGIPGRVEVRKFEKPSLANAKDVGRSPHVMN